MRYIRIDSYFLGLLEFRRVELNSNQIRLKELDSSELKESFDKTFDAVKAYNGKMLIGKEIMKLFFSYLE